MRPEVRAESILQVVLPCLIAPEDKFRTPILKCFYASGLEIISSRHFPDEVQGDIILANAIGYLGIKPPGAWGVVAGQDIAQRVSQIGTLFYFGFFLLMPWWSRLGDFKPVPTRVTFTPH